MKNIILKKLEEIEEKFQVKILYAAECGSRAWGVHSKDSDYDVRFIYIHQPDYYLSIDPQGLGSKRDVIELPINENLDINGWEITKALRLFRKSNPSLFEWLNSSIIYYQKYSFVNLIRALECEVFEPSTMLTHYLNMAKRNYEKYLQGSEVRTKLYLYVLRPILACKWIVEYGKVPPIRFNELLDRIIPESLLKLEINFLLRRKMSGGGSDLQPTIQIINNFLKEEINCLELYVKTLSSRNGNPTEKLNGLYRTTLKEVWNYDFKKS
ncbi:nucleotidyltransferase domain-containing protein [Ureibacillus composti]|nr:nucleotidyltransferase domain-containing protein [Ureibacillus composti]